MLDNQSNVMIEINQGGELVFIIYEAHFYGVLLKLFQIYVIDAISNQSFDHFFKIEPPG